MFNCDIVHLQVWFERRLRVPREEGYVQLKNGLRPVRVRQAQDARHLDHSLSGRENVRCYVQRQESQSLQISVRSDPT